jgi:predicted RNA-binding protein YlxR (DUF448 family)
MSDNDRPEGIEDDQSPLPIAGGALEAHESASTDEDSIDRDALARPARGKNESERTCILSGRKAPRDNLIRLAIGPDGVVAPDVRAKAPGRGAWIGVDRATLEEAITKGRLTKALARAFKGAVNVPADLADQIERALERATLDRLGLEARAGQLLTGTERIIDAARKGTVELMLHARDAAADGTRKLDQALRVGLGVEGTELQGLAIPATRAILSMALGRENVVHLALIAPAAAARVSEALGRWRGYIGLDDKP